MAVDYLNRNDLAFLAQLTTFNINIGSYAAVLGVTQAQMDSLVADANYLNYVVTCSQKLQSDAQAWVVWKKMLRSGGATAVTPGIESRFRAVAQQIKANPNYTRSIGDALGIESAQPAAPDLTTLQPEIELEFTGGQVEIDWGWGGYGKSLDLIELEVDRGDGKGFVILAFDSTPGYTDPTPIPAVPAKWKYRAIY